MTTKIFAKNINHLTDARYFAAWGVTWMCYDPAKIEISEIAVIKEWIEGPKHILDISNIDISEARAMLSTGVVDGYLTSDLQTHSIIQSEINSAVDAFVYARTPKLDAVPVITINSCETGNFDNFICDIVGTPQEIISFVKRNSPFGILLSGGEEEEIGVKSFDDLDTIFEALDES